jgi:hypothetical protein
MPVVPTSIVAAMPVVARAVVTAAVIASISAVPIGITIVSRPGARSIYHRRTVDDRRRINNRRTDIHGARHTDADTDADRHTTGLREAGRPCAKRGSNQKTNELVHLRSPRLESVRTTDWRRRDEVWTKSAKSAFYGVQYAEAIREAESLVL